MYNKNDLLWFYKQMINAVELIKSDADIQINKLKGCCVTDEIALIFYNDVTHKAQILLDENLINKIQFDLITNINDKLEKMSKNKELWSDNELKSNEEWNECRKKGLELLSSLENSNTIDILINEIEEENGLDF
ncbi:hypothetical protein [Clostridium saccharoperbutylacetonicum]